MIMSVITGKCKRKGPMSRLETQGQVCDHREDRELKYLTGRGLSTGVRIGADDVLHEIGALAFAVFKASRDLVGHSGVGVCFPVVEGDG